MVASAGARGRTTKDSDGNYTGKAPAGLVDLKAGIRYLKFNNKRMPGDANKIISMGRVQVVQCQLYWEQRATTKITNLT